MFLNYKWLKHTRKVCCQSKKLLSTNDYFTQEKKKADEDSDRYVGILEAFANMNKRRRPDYHKFNPFTMSFDTITKMIEKGKRNDEIYKQRYITARNEILGNDLAAGHFIVFRGGKVKFIGSDWISKDANETEISPNIMPNKFNKSWLVEAIDASNTLIRYEGLPNIFKLENLNWLSFANCPLVDDWFLDRVSGEYGDNIKHLDLSNCNISINGMSCMYRFQNLEKLVLDNVVKSKEFEYVCLLLEDSLPNLSIEGVNYSIS